MLNRLLPALIILCGFLASCGGDEAFDLTGTWVMRSNACFQLDLVQNGNDLTGILTKPDDTTWNLTGVVSGNSFSFTATGADGVIRGVARITDYLVYITLTFAYTGMSEFSYPEGEWNQI